nr:glycoprotease [Campylobacter sp. RM16187]
MQSDKKSDEALIEIIDEILNKNRYKISKIIYANGPGSFMGIKVSYIILKTLSIIKECEFYAVSGFELNDNAPIRANKALSFVKFQDEIKLEKTETGNFKLPSNLDVLNLNFDTLPNYIIQAV